VVSPLLPTLQSVRINLPCRIDGHAKENYRESILLSPDEVKVFIHYALPSLRHPHMSFSYRPSTDGLTEDESAFYQEDFKVLCKLAGDYDMPSIHQSVSGFMPGSLELTYTNGDVIKTQGPYLIEKDPAFKAMVDKAMAYVPSIALNAHDFDVDEKTKQKA
jgi:hypothetical protein